MELAEARAAVNDMTPSTLRLHQKSVHANRLYTACMLKLMTCYNKQRTPKKRPKRQWLMLLDLLMSSVPNRIIQDLKKRQKELWNPRLSSWRIVSPRPMKWLSKAEETQWLRWNQESGRWKWNWEVYRAELLKPTRVTKSPSAVSRN